MNERAPYPEREVDPGFEELKRLNREERRKATKMEVRLRLIESVLDELGRCADHGNFGISDDLPLGSVIERLKAIIDKAQPIQEGFHACTGSCNDH